MKKEMLINVLQPEECRIAIVEDGVLEELYVERTSQESYVGNIYKGRIVNIEPSIQAAFVDFGIGRNGFLHVSDVEPAYYRHLEPRGTGGGTGRDRGRGGRGGRRRDEDSDRPPRRREAAAEAGEETAEGGEVAASAAEPERGRGRSGSRGRGRRRGRDEGSARRGRPAEPATTPTEETAADVLATPETQAEAAPTEPSPSPRAEAPPVSEPAPETREKPPEEDRPRYMESAEHRTEEETAPSGSAKPVDTINDEDLFFPRTPAPALEPAAEAVPEPTRQEEPRAERLPPEPEPQAEREPQSEPESVLTEDFAEEGLEEDTAMEDFAEAPLSDFDQDFEEDEEPERRRRRGRDDRRGGGRRGGRRGPGRPGMGRPKPLIQDIFKRGQEVLVQVIKEGIGTKGPTLSTYISIAGRYLVLMPGLNRIGVSRKIADDDQRRRLREILSELQPPKGLGFIIRTAGLDKTKKELQRDLAYLSRLWQVVVRRIRKLKSPAEIYQESDMITRTIRDTFTSEIDTIWVDEPAAFDHAQEFLQIVMPRYANRIKLYADSEPLFYRYGIEDEISRIQQRHVPLPNGGSIVIDQTEALVAIDVNSGNFRADNNAEETAFQMNLLAAKEIARQLRLRDLGGVIVNDFIDMREEKHRREVERAMREAVKRDRARTKILKISAFGIIEMTRQRIRPSLKRSVYQDCPHCRGTSQVKTCESMSIDVMRMIQLAAHREGIHQIQIRVHEDVANYLLNKKRKEISRLEESGELQVTITGQANVSPEALEFVCYDHNNNEVRFLPYDENRPQRRR
jgi:ribonuclease E